MPTRKKILSTKIMYYNVMAVQMTEINCLKMSTLKVIVTFCVFYISFLNVLFTILRKILHAAYKNG